MATFTCALQVYAAYYQLYLQDIDSPCDTSKLWDDPADTERGFVAGEGLIALSTKRYETVPLMLEVSDADPGFSWASVDRVSEGGLAIGTQLMVGMPIGSLTPIPEVKPGVYAVRALASGLDSVVDDWNGNDRYTVQLWPAPTLRPVRHVTRPPRQP